MLRLRQSSTRGLRVGRAYFLGWEFASAFGQVKRQMLDGSYCFLLLDASVADGGKLKLPIIYAEAICSAASRGAGG